MKTKMLLLTLFVGVLLIAASDGAYEPSPLHAPEDCDMALGQPMVLENYQNSVVSYKKQLCAAAGTGVVTFTEWLDGVTPVSSPATPQEIVRWNNHVLESNNATELADSANRLAAEVEPGKKAVEILREWSTQAMVINASWDSLTENQKDDRVKELFRRNAIFWDKYADDLVTRGLGQ